MLIFSVVDARPSPQTAAPGVTLRLRIENYSGRPVHALALRMQTSIDARGHRYTKEEQARLYELFGDVSQWDKTLRGVTWAQTSLVVPAFENHADVDAPLSCTYDLEVAAGKYFNAVRDGDVSLVCVFSGSVFRVTEHGALEVQPVAWDVEARYRLPARVWHDAMERFFPGGGWLRLSRETIDRLQAFRGRNAVVSWDEAIDLLLQKGATTEQPA
jgi:hypothetical protein